MPAAMMDHDRIHLAASHRVAGRPRFGMWHRATKLVLMATALTVGAGANAQQATENAGAEVLVARGVLSRIGKAGTLWNLKVDNGPSFRGEIVRQANFTTRPGDEDSHAYAAYDGRYVEIQAEVKSTFHGIAILRNVRTIGVVESAPVQVLGAEGIPSIAPAPVEGGRSERVPYRHAYYLFLGGAGQNCESCYVPLLICRDSFGVIAAGASPAHCVYIVTYERDSIWETKGAARIEPSAIDANARILRLNGKSYRYQEIDGAEVVNLLEHPAGTIPISRPLIVNKTVPGASLMELKDDFRRKPGIH